MLGAGGILGFVWFVDSVPPTSFAIPLFLFTLAILPADLVARHFWLVLLGIALCVVDLGVRGLPFVRAYEELDVEVLSAIQLVLIAYFIIAVSRSARSGIG